MPHGEGKPTVRSGAPGDDVYRVLVVAADEHIAEPVRRELDERADGRRPEVRVVAPALTATAFKHAAGDVDEARERAERRLEHSLDEARQQGLEAEGQVGDSDPLLAIEDALYEFPADEIVVVTHESDESSMWLEEDLFDRARKRFEVPISNFVADGGVTRPKGRSEGGADPSSQQEVETDSRNLPRFSARDIAGMVFAVVGTGILIVIAATNPDETGSGFDFDAIHTIIAGAFALINIAHIVGLVLFESVGYRGFAQRFFAELSLYGTTAAIAVSLLLLLV